MCDQQLIRYVHTMVHANFHQPLRCGHICAGKMECDPAAAKKRELNLKSIAGKRQRFLRKDFKTSKKGHLYTKLGTRQVGIMAKPGYYCVWIGDTFGTKRYDTILAAKKAIFDAIYNHGF